MLETDFDTWDKLHQEEKTGEYFFSLSVVDMGCWRGRGEKNK